MMIDGVLHRSAAVADPRQSACRCHSRHMRNGGHSDFIAFGTRPVSASKNSVPGDRAFSAKFNRTAPVIRMFCAAVISGLKIGSALFRGKVEISVVAASLKKKKI